MSETAAAPVEAPTVTAPVTPTAPPATPPAEAPAAPKISARDFDRRMSASARTQEPAPAAPPAPAAEPPVPVGTVDENGRPHAAPGTEKAGQFLPGKVAGETEPAPAAPSGSGAEPPANPPEGSQAERADAPATPDGVPAGHVRIPIPESLQRTFGKHRDVPQGEEQWFRFNLNNHVRKEENEALARDRKTLLDRAEKAEEEARRLKAVPAASEKFRQSPKYAEIAEKLKAMRQNEADGYLPAGTADDYERAVLAPVQKEFEDAEFTSLTEADQKVQREENSKRWMDESWKLSLESIPATVAALPGFQDIWRQEVVAFNARLTDKNYRPDITDNASAHAAFVELLKARLWLEPDAKALIRAEINRGKSEAAAAREVEAQEQRAKAERDAEAKRRADAEAEARRIREQNPMGAVPSGRAMRSAGGAERQPINAREFDRQMTTRRR